MNRFARLLYDAVKRNNITYKKAASWADVSPDLLSRIILGNRLPSPRNGIKIARALGIDEQEALNAINYDKVPPAAKKYFVPPKPRHSKIRDFIFSTYRGDSAVRKKLVEEITSFSFGSMETLILSRLLIAIREYSENRARQKNSPERTREDLKYIKDLLKKPIIETDDEEKLLGILSIISKWEAISPDYSLQTWLNNPDGSLSAVTTGETRFEKPMITFTGSEPVEVPLLEDKIAAGVPLPISGNWNETRFFTSSFLKKFKDPLLIEVGKDQDSMIPVIFPGDLLLIDRKPVEKPKREHIYAVNLEEGGSVKYCYIENNKLHITCENKFCDFKPVILDISGRDLNRVIVGEVVWVGREIPRK